VKELKQSIKEKEKNLKKEDIHNFSFISTLSYDSIETSEEIWEIISDIYFNKISIFKYSWSEVYIDNTGYCLLTINRLNNKKIQHKFKNIDFKNRLMIISDVELNFIFEINDKLTKNYEIEESEYYYVKDDEDEDRWIDDGIISLKAILSSNIDSFMNMKLDFMLNLIELCVCFETRNDYRDMTLSKSDVEVSIKVIQLKYLSKELNEKNLNNLLEVKNFKIQKKQKEIIRKLYKNNIVNF